MKTYNRNIRVKAVNNGVSSGFNIYLDFSGQHEYLMFHRHNGFVYDMLKDGIAVDDVRRWIWGVAIRRTNCKCKYARTSKTKSIIKHILAVIDEYMAEREAC